MPPGPALDPIRQELCWGSQGAQRGLPRRGCCWRSRTDTGLPPCRLRDGLNWGVPATEMPPARDPAPSSAGRPCPAGPLLLSREGGGRGRRARCILPQPLPLWVRLFHAPSACFGALPTAPPNPAPAVCPPSSLPRPGSENRAFETQAFGLGQERTLGPRRHPSVHPLTVCSWTCWVTFHGLIYHSRGAQTLGTGTGT